jgi:hypothetical protein
MVLARGGMGGSDCILLRVDDHRYGSSPISSNAIG